MKYLYQNKHWELNKEYNLDKLLYLMIDRPNGIDSFSYDWRNIQKQYHREYDLPSFVGFNNINKICKLYWDKNGKPYRKTDKPTIIFYDGYKEYYVNGKFIRTETIK